MSHCLQDFLPNVLKLANSVNTVYESEGWCEDGYLYTLEIMLHTSMD